MPAKQTSPKPPANTPEAPLVKARDWVAGNGPLQVPVAGLLTRDPTLRTAELTPEQWAAKLDEYLRTPTRR